MLILLSNDDGINSKGLTALEHSLKNLGDVWTVAPEHSQSAMGRALTLKRPLKVSQLTARRFMIDGTPSDCVNIALNGLLPEKPAVVVSGINKGPNMGDDISYSGTVAAAFEAAIRGIPAVAVSLACRDNFHFTPGADFTARVVEKIVQSSLSTDTFLNINIPDTAGKPVSEYRITFQGKCIYDSTITEFIDPRGEKFCSIGGTDVGFKSIPGSDADAIAENVVSITPLSTDLTHHAAREALEKIIF